MTEDSAAESGLINRRRFLGGVAAASIAGTAGCLGDGVSMEFTAGADVFEVVNFTKKLPLSDYSAEIRVTLPVDEPVSYLICIDDGEQYTAARLGTGTNTGELDVPAGESTILAVQGGRTEDGKVLGGTIAARGTLEVSG